MSATADPATVQRLLGTIRVQTSTSGALTIEAPPEAAATLAAMFSTMAAMLQAAGSTERTPPA